MLNANAFPLSAWLPSEPPRPAPALLTSAEAAVYLRLDVGERDIGDAIQSLAYLVAQGRIRPCRVGRHNRFMRAELDRFMAEQTERYVGGKDKGAEPSDGSRVLKDGRDA